MTPPTIEPLECKHTLHQAGCVSVGGRGILIEGLPGSGKSSLALMLLDRGAQLVGDDGVTLEVRNGRLWASPHPYIAGKLEIRNVGIVDLPAVEAPVSLRLVLSDHAPRFVEIAEKTGLEGAQIPTLCFDARGAAAAIRAEYALTLHGLSLPVQGNNTESTLPMARK